MSHDIVGRVCELWYSSHGPVSCDAGGHGMVAVVLGTDCGTSDYCDCGSLPVNLRLAANDRSRPVSLELARGREGWSTNCVSGDFVAGALLLQGGCLEWKSPSLTSLQLSD